MSFFISFCNRTEKRKGRIISFFKIMMPLISLLFSLSVARAQEILTVYEDYQKSSSIPIYMYWADELTRSQFVIPSTDLEEMTGGGITSIIFYTDSYAGNEPYPSSGQTSCRIEVYIKEVNYTSMTNLEQRTGCTTVYSGFIREYTDSDPCTVSIVFNTPYNYNGGNLLIGIDVVEPGQYSSMRFKGATVSGASMSGHDNLSNNNITGSAANFIPKTTFNYTTPPGRPERPSSFTATPITGNKESLSWTGGTGVYNLDYRGWLDYEWTRLATNTTDNHFTLTDLKEDYEYYARVQSVGENEMGSQWNEITFKTIISCPKPTSFTCSSVSANTATLIWTEQGTASMWEICVDDDEDNTIIVTGNPVYTFTGLTPETSYKAKVRSINNPDDKSSWTDAIIFVPTSKYCVGSGETTDISLPTVTADRYCLSQQIYTPSELGAADNILSIAFFATNAYTRDFDIYMVHTDKSSFNKNTDWVDVSDADLVFSGEVAFIKNNWTTIELDRAFAYDGQSNVLLVVDDNRGKFLIADMKFLVYSSDQKQSICTCGDENFDPTVASSYGGTRQYIKNQLRIVKGSAPITQKPENVSVDYQYGTTATVSWTGSAATFDMDLNGTLIENVTSPYTLTGLDYTTSYSIKIRACNGTFLSGWTNPVLFTTKKSCPDPTELTLTELSATTATVSWKENGGATKWELYVSELGSDIIVSDNHYTITGLSPERTYTVKVRAINNEEDISSWSERLYFEPTSKHLVGLGVNKISKTLPIVIEDYQSVTEQIYTPMEFGAAASVYSIDLYSDYNSSCDLDIYMAHTDHTAFSSDDDWIIANKADLVFSGRVDFSGNTWNTIDLDKPFNYDGQSNVLLVIDDNSKKHKYRYMGFRVFSTLSPQTIVGRYHSSQIDDMDPSDKSTISEYGRYLSKAVLRLVKGNPPTASKPQDFTVDYTGGSEAVVSWTSAESHFDLFVNGSVIENVTSPYTLTGLQDGNAYNVKVRARNDSGISLWTSAVNFEATSKRLIGIGSDLSNELPTPMSPYSLTQQIYKASELGEAGVIVSFDVYSFIDSYGSVDRLLDVYMVHTNKEYFGENNDWINVSADDLVFSGNASFSENGWSTVSLDYPFKYDGQSNVALIVYDHTGNYYSYRNYFRVMKSTTVQSIKMESPYETIDPLNIDEDYYGKNYDRNVIRFKKEAASTALIPQKLKVEYNGGSHVVITWSSKEPYVDVDLNGIILQNATSPCLVAPLEYGKTYNVRVRSKDGDFESEWSSPVSFRTVDSPEVLHINYTITGLSGIEIGSGIKVLDDDDNVVEDLTFKDYDDYSISGSIDLNPDNYYKFIWCHKESYHECSLLFTGSDGTVLFSTENSNEYTDGAIIYVIDSNPNSRPFGLVNSAPGIRSVVLNWNESGSASTWQICVNGDENNLITTSNNPYTLTGLNPETDYSVRVRSYYNNASYSRWSSSLHFTTAVASPMPVDLSESDVTSISANLNWAGNNDSYVLQYAPWTRIGDDVETTSSLKSYSFDLSAYSGTGSIAIRHYNVTNKSYLLVDDILVTDHSGNTVFQEDFEFATSEWPSALSVFDMDGDGNTWNHSDHVYYSEGICNGDYCAESYSKSDDGPLTPDNWLIIPNVELGGTLSFMARGKSYVEMENFGVYVSKDASVTEIAVSSNTYQLNNLSQDTPYRWRVRGYVGQDASRWAFSIFQTQEQIKTFVADGNWNDASKWFPEGVPGADDNILIDANVIIPSGVLAIANHTTLSPNGSITIKDGGQLKQSSDNLKVTMEKTVSADKYLLISSPLTGWTLLSDDGSENHVSHLTDGNYDLYTLDSVPEVWVNFKANYPYDIFHSSDGSYTGLINGLGYLYANENNTTLQFTGLTLSGRKAITNNSGSSCFVVGNPYTCDCYVSGSDGGFAYFYIVNDTGDGWVCCEGGVIKLSPGEGALALADGPLTFSTDAPSGTIVMSGNDPFPFLPLHGVVGNQKLTDCSITEDGKTLPVIKTYYPNKKVNVLFARSFTENVASTLCVPFSMTSVPGGTLYEFADVVYDNTEGWVAIMQQTNVAESPTVANRPYLFMPNVTGKVLFRGVIDKVPSTFTAGESTATHTGGDGGSWTFHGTYSTITWDASLGTFYGFAAKSYSTSSYAISPGDFVRAKDGASVPPFRCYLTYNGTKLKAPLQGSGFSGTDSMPSNIKVKLLGLDGTVTTVGSIEIEIKDADTDSWYDMNGRKLQNKPTDSGLYIHQGKAVMVK